MKFFTSVFVLIISVLLLLSRCDRTLHVTLDTAGGEISCETEIDFEPSNPPEIPAPTREGYIFAGWSGGDDWLTEGGTLVAEWSKPKYHVDFDLDGGESDSFDLLSQDVDEGGGAVEPQNVRREHYTFLGWSEDFSSVNGDIVVKAMWQMDDIGEEKIKELCDTRCVEIYAYDRSDIPVALGSGFFISNDGIFVTAAHVVKGCSDVEAILYNGERIFATEMLYYDAANDLAVLKIDGSYDCFEVFCDLPDENQKVYTVGSPDGRTGEMSTGSIIRMTDDYGIDGLIASTLHLEGGSSGSPMVDSVGRVIGINVARSGAQNESLTVPASAIPENFEGAISMTEFAAVSRGDADDVDETEPNNIPERADIPESGIIVRGSLSDGNDIDCYSIESVVNYKIIISIPDEYYNITNIKLYSPDGKYKAQTWNTIGHSGKYRLYYAILNADSPVSVFIEIGGTEYSPKELEYALRVYDLS